MEGWVDSLGTPFGASVSRERGNKALPFCPSYLTIPPLLGNWGEAMGQPSPFLSFFCPCRGALGLVEAEVLRAGEKGMPLSLRLTVIRGSPSNQHEA